MGLGAVGGLPDSRACLMLRLPPALPRGGSELDFARSGKIKFYTLSYTCEPQNKLTLAPVPTQL